MRFTFRFLLQSRAYLSMFWQSFQVLLCPSGTLLGDYFSNTFATLLMFSRGWCMCLGLSEFKMFICMFQILSMCSWAFHGRDWGTPAYLDYKYVLVVASHTRANTMLSILWHCICRHVAHDLQAIMLRWTSNNPVERLFWKSIAPRGCAEAKW